MRVDGTSPLLAYFGHHKCATQWMNGIVADICRTIGRERIVINGPRDFETDVASTIPDQSAAFLCYVNAQADQLRGLDPLRGFHVIRDPRDIVVSAYFSHRYSHPPFGDLLDYRNRLEALPEREGLMLELERRQHQFTAMREWDYGRADILELRMEDLTTDPASGLTRIVEFLGIDGKGGVAPKTIAAIVRARAFEKLAGGRARGEEDVTSHLRKGVAGDWVNHFEAEHVDYFKEYYGDLLQVLGYESSDDWSHVHA